MNNVVIIVAMILFSCCVTSQVTARDLEFNPSLRNEKLEWWHYHYNPYFHPKPYWPFPAAGKALPPLPAGSDHYFHPIPFHPPPEVTTCLSDSKEVTTCFSDIIKAFFTRKPALESDCCTAVEKMDKDCEKTVFGAFHNPFFNCYIKLHCSSKAGSTPSAPSPA